MDEPDADPARLTRRPPWRGSRCACALLLSLPLLAHANCKVDTIELPVRIADSRAIATVGINGTSIPLTVDSGADFSLLTDATAAQLMLPLKRLPAGLRFDGLTGKVDAQMTTVDKLHLFKDDIGGVQFVVGGNEPGAGTMGLMGRNILSMADTEYDLAHGVIRFMAPNDECAKSSMAYWAGEAPVNEVALIKDYQSRTPAIRAHVRLNGSDVVALFDTGAPTIVSSLAARRIGIAESDLKPAGRMYGAGRGVARQWTASFEKFELGTEATSNNRLLVGDFNLASADMLLGIDFFLSHRIYVSRQQSRLFITYNGGPVFGLDRREVAGGKSADEDPAPSDGPAVTADQLARRAAASAARRDYESALADLNRACELEPTTAAWFAQRGVLQDTLKRPAKALEDFDRARLREPTQPDALYHRAVLRVDAKDRDGAKDDLDALDRTLAPQAQMRLAMSQLYLGLGRPAETLAQLNRWLAAHPNEMRRDVAQNRRCWARAALGVELEEALADCDEAIGADAKNANYYDSRGWVYLRLGRYEKAVADFDRSIEYRSANAYSLYGRGLAKTRLGDAARGDADLAAARRMLTDIDGKLASIGMTRGMTAGSTESPVKR